MGFTFWQTLSSFVLLLLPTQTHISSQAFCTIIDAHKKRKQKFSPFYIRETKFPKVSQ
jgi:hypothetical protein